MATLSDRDFAFNTYCQLVGETRKRHAVAKSLVNGPIIDPQIIAEFCYLQLRKICELIALGCLIAHGDVKLVHTAKLLNEWNADRIISVLEKLHGNRAGLGNLHRTIGGVSA
jgi:hypothetical protein